MNSPLETEEFGSVRQFISMVDPVLVLLLVLLRTGVRHVL